MPGIGKRTVRKETRFRVCLTTSQHMQGNRGEIRQ
jgi:hypothetical protein